MHYLFEGYRALGEIDTFKSEMPTYMPQRYSIIYCQFTWPQQTKFSGCNLQIDGLPSYKSDPSILSVLFRKIVFQINVNQSIITQESFRSDRVEIKHI